MLWYWVLVWSFSGTGAIPRTSTPHEVSFRRTLVVLELDASSSLMVVGSWCVTGPSLVRSGGIALSGSCIALDVWVFSMFLNRQRWCLEARRDNDGIGDEKFSQSQVANRRAQRNECSYAKRGDLCRIPQTRACFWREESKESLLLVPEKKKWSGLGA
ncbi:hypothetical protein MPH_07633 [Macrophomina phaseolina MS6]|uniref:Secreted protein n=1 Tax=Macrophomina phaseolina (strain MS6) TaxID=1126212 RepID=K2QYY4_MACPH|nr:hypothetical protein MPH_07633 [Macrophomina phaseolina MS6]